VSNVDDRLVNIDIFGALRRRKWAGILIAILGFCLTAYTVVTWPDTYRSTATILIEEPEVPADLVKSTVSSFAAERLQLIQQRVMTSDHMMGIIDQFDLYAGMRQEQPISMVIAAFRSKVLLEVVSANLSGQQPTKYQRQPQASIAFNLSFEDRDPVVAQKVAQRLMELYLAENDRTRKQRAEGATQFLSEQAQKLEAEVRDLEKRLTELKSKHSGSLPEQFNMNMQLLNSAQNQLLQHRADMQAIMEKRAFLQSQLAQISPYSTMTANGRPATPQAQLLAMELQYSELSAKYGTKHPDVIRVQRQIETLKAQLGNVDNASLDRAKLETLQAQLTEAQQRYGDKHPEVQRLRKQIEEVQAKMRAAPPPALSIPQGPPDNPIYIQLQSQLADSDAQLRGIQERTSSLEANVEMLQGRILQTPAIESEYNAILNQYNLALQRYQSFKDKEADAAVTQSMEQQNKGETFSVLEEPVLPELPASPNRKLLSAVGVVLSLMLAAAVMLAFDMLDPRIYEAKSLLAAFGEMPLVTVPYIATRSERRSRRLRLASIVGAVVIVAGGLLALYYLNFPIPGELAAAP